MTEFKVGDRVAMYSAKYGRKTGTIVQLFSVAGENDFCFDVQETNGSRYAAHPKQCRKLKPRAKSIRITKEKLVEAWDDCVARHYPAYVAANSKSFARFAKSLGLDNEA